MNTGHKAKSSLLDITVPAFRIFDRLAEIEPVQWKKLDRHSPRSGSFSGEKTSLLIDATGFAPEGIDPHRSLAALLSEAYRKGWRRFFLYRVNGQRLISTAVMGSGDTDDVEMEIYGTPGEYFGAFMQGE